MRLEAVLALAMPLAIALAGCSTYRSDLGRARSHYDKNEYDQALALLRVLEPDIDSFDPGEHAQYAYSRGMTDYRLAGLATAGTGFNDPKGAFRSHARHWLAIARAVDKESPGGLTDEEKGRLAEALTDLDKDVFGELGQEGGPSSPPAAKPPPKRDPEMP